MDLCGVKYLALCPATQVPTYSDDGAERIGEDRERHKFSKDITLLVTVISEYVLNPLEAKKPRKYS